MKHPIRNKLKHAVRHSKLWAGKVFKNRKKEFKKKGYE